MNSNSKFLFQLFILLTVPLNTAKAIQVVQAKLNSSPHVSTISVDSQFKSARLLSINSDINIQTVNPSVTNPPPGFLNKSDLPKFDSQELVFQGPGTILVPILLYHRIDVSETGSKYYVSPDKFEEQMRLLQEWGYTTITTELLVKAIDEGADLPQRPIIITFDDGHLNNYTAAFPIMEKYGFTGVLYIVGRYMGTPEYMNVEQIREMAQSGWEVGSHSMNHLDLTSLDSEQQRYEIIESRKFLETELGLPIRTFSYPFGVKDTTVVNLVYSTGYIAAMGTGYTYDQGVLNLFALQRRSPNGMHDLNSFASTLPWQGDSAYLLDDILISSSQELDQ